MKTLTLGFFAVGAVATGALAWACVDSGPPPPCFSYCHDIQSACTGDDQQYEDEPTCERFCAQWDTGEAGVAAGDTVACREVAVSNTKDETSPTAKHQECVGGGIAAGQCTGNDPCQPFCAVDMKLCSGLNGYNTIQDCLSACATWGKSFDGPVLDSTGNTLSCRTYHLELSQTGLESDLKTHCPHTGAVSAKCFDADGGSDAGSDAASDAASDAPSD